MTDRDRVADETPVIVGAGCFQQHCEDPLLSLEPCELMVRAVRRAAEDAGRDSLLRQADRISVPQGTWEYTNPAALIADSIEAKRARTVFVTVGILQLTLVSDACRAIASGAENVAIVTGGDARYRDLRARIEGVAVHNTPQNGDRADVHLASSDPMWAQLEVDRGLVMPTEFFSIMESSLRRQRGLDIERHRDEIARLYADFSEVAATNPHAWKRETFSAEEIRDASETNAMISFPYTKRHNTQWNVNQAAALIICSAGKARELNIDPERWVFPLVATESNDVVPMSQRRAMYSSVGTRTAAAKLMDLAGIEPADIDHVELYSCFPAAVQSFALDSGLGLDRPLTVTGGMPFAGGPLNNFTLQSLVRMAEVLREDRGSIGLVSGLSGMIGKQGFVLLSAEAGEKGYQFADVTDETAAENVALELDGAYEGRATVAGYTVIYSKNRIARGIVVCDTPGGGRTLAQCFDAGQLERMTREEFCGREVEIDGQGQFSIA